MKDLYDGTVKRFCLIHLWIVSAYKKAYLKDTDTYFLNTYTDVDYCEFFKSVCGKDLTIIMHQYMKMDNNPIKWHKLIE